MARKTTSRLPFDCNETTARPLSGSLRQASPGVTVANQGVTAATPDKSSYLFFLILRRIATNEDILTNLATYKMIKDPAPRVAALACGRCGNRFLLSYRLSWPGFHRLPFLPLSHHQRLLPKKSRLLAACLRTPGCADVS